MPRSCYTCLLGLLLAAQVSGQFGGVPTPIPCTGCPLPLVVDFDGANGPDLLFADGTSLRWMANDGNGVFTDPVELAQNPDSMISNLAQDVDGDADIDVVGITTTFDGTSIWLMRNDGTDGFSQVLIDTVGATFRAPKTAADLDNDGDLDLLGVDHYSGELWYRNNGDGSYAREVIGTWCANGIKGPYTPVDIDDDGDLDLVGFAVPLGRLIVHWNLGRGRFGPFTIATGYSGSYPAGLAIDAVDVDEDGFTDVIAGGRAMISSGYGTFAGTGSNPSSREFQSIGNVDCDTDLEAVLSSNASTSVSAYDLETELEYDLEIPGNVVSTLADLDGDGRLDLVTRATADGSLSWRTNISVPPVVTLDLPDTLYLSEPFELTGGEPVSTAGVYSGAGVFDGTLYPALVGTGSTVITYTYSDFNAFTGCIGDATDTVYVANQTSIAEHTERNFMIYPNPVKDLLYFHLDGSGMHEVAVYDLVGRKIRQERIALPGDGSAQPLPVGELANGCYQLRVSVGGTPVASAPFAVDH